MNFQFSPMSQSEAAQIADWHYEGIYSFYDMKNDPEDLQELLSPKLRGENYWSAVSDGELIGFIAVYPDRDSVELGLGLRPNLTGKGIGSAFLYAAQTFIQEHYPFAITLSLAVASFNIRAQKVYEKAGFLVCGQETVSTNGGQYPFILMEKQLSDNKQL